MPLDLTLTPLYRTEGKEQASLPGLMPAMPPRKTARGREHDRLVVYLLLTGNTSYFNRRILHNSPAAPRSRFMKRPAH